MLRTVFIGSYWEFTEVLVHWLGRHSVLAGVVWTDATAWQKSWRGRLSFARRRLARRGLLRTVDEALMFAYYHSVLRKGDDADLKRCVIDPYWREYGREPWSGDSILVDDVNSPESLSFLRRCQPDMGLTMCISSYFTRELRSIPRQGLFLWHEGITPEYRGLYSPFWAVHELDFDRLGYTLLRTDDGYDTGEVFAQGRVQGVDPFRHSHGYIGHKAIFDSLPAIGRLFEEIESGTAVPIRRDGARRAYYTYPGISDLIRQRLRLRRVSPRIPARSEREEGRAANRVR
jgi:hypothetical protein